jgi:DNA topoisomerase-1
MAAKGNYLVVVESPAKAKTIKKYLGAKYTVKASVGHVMDLPKSKMGVDFERDFEPQYEVIRGKKKVLDDIKKAAMKADTIFLATDPDREGEAIAFHIADQIRDQAGGKSNIFRVLFNEITKKAILEAIKKPQQLDEKKFDAQQARRILDRLVGYQISPILWAKVRRGLSAGRVQSVAVRLVVERETEIKAFKPEEYWSLEADLAAKLPPQFRAKLAKVDGKKAELTNGTITNGLVTELQKAIYEVTKVDRKERRRNPPAPFTTSKMQQDAANRLHFSAKKTMTIAQHLYEGKELGEEGAVGLITYMRTDSTRLSNDAVTEARELIAKQYGKEYVPGEANVFKSRKNAQDAHEAIRPTSLAYPPEKVKAFLDRDELRLYELIWNRFVGCQMMPAVYDQTAVDISAGRGVFRANGSILKFPGYLAAYGEKIEDDSQKRKDETEGEGEDDASRELPPIEVGEKLKLQKLLPEQHFTQPPPRFSEATLVKELEEKGIGRPSTYASILSVIQDKEYVKKLEGGRFQPTELGTLVTGELVKNFPTELDVTFTAGMEEKLDKIEEGEANWVHVLREFYNHFKEDVAKAEVAMRDVKREEIATEINCEKCGKPMVIKWGKMGQFLACSGYPECKSTKDFKRAEDGKITPVTEELTDEKCVNCGKPMIIKRGRFGKFMACSGYPECKTSKPISIGMNCPSCKIGYLTERRTGRGKIFFGCSRYKKDDPEACTFAAWDRPLLEACPECGSSYLLSKYSKRDGPYIACPNKECDYKRVIEQDTPSSAGDEVEASGS